MQESQFSEEQPASHDSRACYDGLQSHHAHSFVYKATSWSVGTPRSGPGRAALTVAIGYECWAALMLSSSFLNLGDAQHFITFCE